MHNVLICPFGDVNLLASLGEKLRSSAPVYAPTYLCFTEYEREIYRSHRLPHVFIPPGERNSYLSSQSLAEATQFTKVLAKRHLGHPCDREIEAAAHHYAYAIARVIEEGAFRDIVLFNGRHNLFVAVLDQVADLLGCEKLVFEQGLFRPGYVTIDGAGVNARNSVRSLDALLGEDDLGYRSRPLYRAIVSQFPLLSSERCDFKQGVDLWRLSMAYAHSKLQPSHRLYLRSAENRDLLESALLPTKQKVAKTNCLERLLHDPQYDYVILCPLQVETDTQIVLHSPWIRSMQDLVDHVAEAVAAFNRQSIKKACVLFKVHPMEQRRVTVTSPDAYLIHESTVTDILQRRCDLVVTINSTAGIEAIEKQLPVITLGDAFYSFPGVVHSNCLDASSLKEQLTSGLLTPRHDIALQQRFIGALKHKYQVRVQPTIQAAAPLTPVEPVSSPAGV
jgi:capsular polysaccharide export protein